MVRALVVVASLLGYTSPALAQQLVVVLKIAEVPSTPRDGAYTIRLASGATITVPAADLDATQSYELNQKAVPVSVAPSTSSTRDKCTKEWPTDFRMRAYCEKQQTEAAAALKARTMASADQRTIRDHCSKEWPDDLRMRNYCEEQQLKALGTLR